MKDKELELPKAYEAKDVEPKWYAFWEQHHFFEADVNSSKPPYCIVIPPPNVTGVLHMGHALVNTLQDILIRWKRMSGYEALWVPGTDHAGIATQTVVERHLIKTTGKRRKDFSREIFLQHVWDWKEKNESLILNQLKQIGSSCDWTRLRFTMDEGCNGAVRVMFKKLFDEGLIYRGNYLVNWDPVTQTALADDEVEYEERQSFLWYFQYPLKDGSGVVRVATTRPETMLGDTAVAVSPRDERYSSFIGKIVVHPLTKREIPVIADHLVDPEFGTGMVKITPAHDPNDYQMGLSHRLPFVNIMTPDGKINENGMQFAGMTMEEARKAVVEEMKKLGYLEKIEPHLNRVGVSYRSKAVIEPYMSKQWFVKMEGFAQKLRDAVKLGKTKLIPQNWENTYFYWVDNLRDWCISRQLWWGHRIPIWYNRNDPEQMICFEGQGEPPEVARSPQDWMQDEDVLDTWFSSALWPFSTLGWPNETQDLKKFYPNSVLITGHDILFFWVARMILMGEYALGQVPFPETFLHGLIYGKSYWRDAPGGGIHYLGDQERLEYDRGKPIPKDVHFKWEKMSKSKGNIIDPLEISGEYGTDAMRMALCSSATQAREIDLDRRRFEDYKNFANKVWNGARFIFLNLFDPSHPELALTSEEFSTGLNDNLLRLEDRWILSVLNRTVRDVNKHLTAYAFDRASGCAYDFYWNEFCSYYLEISKPVLFGKVGNADDRKNKQKILAIVLCSAVRLLHPMAPFITEELFQQLKLQLADVKLSGNVDPYTEETIKALHSPACIVAPYPTVIRESDCNPKIDSAFELIGSIVYAIRNIRGEIKISPGTATDVYIIGESSDPQFTVVQDHLDIIRALVKVKTIEMQTQEPNKGLSAATQLGSLKIVVPLPEELVKQEKTRLSKEKERLMQNLERFQIQLSNEEFIRKAPPQLIEKQQTQMVQMQSELSEITSKLSQME